MPKSAPNVASKPTTTTTATTTAAPVPAPAPSSPPTMTSEPSWLTGPALKAANEHTFATQRAKKAADRAKGKAPPRKAPATSAASTVGRSSSSSTSAAAAAFTMSYGSAAAMASVWAEVWDARRPGAAADDDTDWPELPTGIPLSLSQRFPPSPPAEYALRPTQGREVPLLALARPVKARGGKAKGAFNNPFTSRT